MIKFILFYFIFILVGCKEKFEADGSLDMNFINKFCEQKEPNVDLDVEKYLPKINSKNEPIVGNLGIKSNVFFERLQNDKKISNMNIYQNEGVVDIFDDNYNNIGKVFIVVDGDYIKYIKLRVSDGIDFFENKNVSNALIGVIDALGQKVNSNLIYYSILNSLKENIYLKKSDSKSGLYIGDYESNHLYYELVTINSEFISGEVKKGNIKDVNCNLKKYSDYNNLKVSLFSIYSK